MLALIVLQASTHNLASRVPIGEIERLGYEVSKSRKGPTNYRGTLAGVIDLEIRVTGIPDNATRGKIDRRLFNAPFLGKGKPPSGMPIGSEALIAEHLPWRLTIIAASTNANVFVYATDYSKDKKALTRERMSGVERIIRYTLSIAEAKTASDGVDLTQWAASGKWRASRDEVGSTIFERGTDRVLVPLASDRAKIGTRWHGFTGITYFKGGHLFAPKSVLKLLPE